MSKLGRDLQVKHTPNTCLHGSEARFLASSNLVFGFSQQQAYENLKYYNISTKNTSININIRKLSLS